MIRCIIKMSPGLRDVDEWRIAFSNDPGSSPVVYNFKGSLDELRTFLRDRVEVPESKLSGIAAQLVSANIAHFECDLTVAEARDLVRQIQREVKQQAAEGAKGAKSGSGAGEQQTSPVHTH